MGRPEQAGLIPTASSVVTTERPAGTKAEWLDIPFWMLAGARPEAALGKADAGQERAA